MIRRKRINMKTTQMTVGQLKRILAIIDNNVKIVFQGNGTEGYTSSCGYLADSFMRSNALKSELVLECIITEQE
jgi:hypothetical protein